MLPPHLILIAFNILEIAWNLVLAAIPCLLAYELIHWIKNRSWKKLGWIDRLIAIFAFLIWLFFFPNTAYLFTEVRHLVDHCADYDRYRVCVEEAWKVPTLFLFALLGVPFFAYALQQMKKAITILFSKKTGAVFIFIVIPLTALGILFGLYERWNTWDIITKPWSMIVQAFDYLLTPIIFVNWAVYTVVLFLIYYGTVYLWNARQK